MNQVKTYRSGEAAVEVRTEETPTYTTFTSGSLEPRYIGDDFTDAAKSLEMSEDNFDALLMSDEEDESAPNFHPALEAAKALPELDAKISEVLNAGYTDAQISQIICRIVAGQIDLNSELVDSLRECLKIVKDEYIEDPLPEDMTSWTRAIENAEAVLAKLPMV